MLIKRLTYYLLFFQLMAFTAFSQTNLHWDWVRTAGGNLYQYASSIAVDNNKNIFIAATFNSNTISIGTNNVILTSNDTAGISNFFVAKYNQSGQVIWAKKAISTAAMSSNKVITDNSGNIYACGYLNSNSAIQTVSFDGINTYAINGGKSFVVKYNSSGNTQWVIFTKNSVYDTISGLKWDALTNSVIIAGYCRTDTVKVGNIMIPNSGINTYNSYVAKINNLQGNVDWVKASKGSPSFCRINDMCIDTIGNIYTAASFSSRTFFISTSTSDSVSNSNVSTGIISVEGYIAKYSLSGFLYWWRKGICLADDEFTTITFKNNSRLVAGGYNTAQITIGGTVLNTANYITEYNDQGVFISGVSFPSTIKTLNANKIGNGFVIGGIFNSDTLSIGSSILLKKGAGNPNPNIFIAKADNLGTYTHAVSAGGVGSAYLNSMAIGDSNEIYCSGSFNQSSVYFDTIQYFIHGQTDLYLAKLTTATVLPIPFKYNLGGTVFAGNLPADLAKVYLLDSSLTIVDSCNVDTLGFYSFYQKPIGNYKVNATLLPASVYFMQNYITTFYPDQLSPATASNIYLNLNAWAKDIYLQKSNQISEIKNYDKNLIIYPDPAVNELFISINTENKANAELKIFNSNGQLVYNLHHKLNAGKDVIKLNIRDFKSGLYFVVIKTNENTVLKSRFIKAE
ncbi:MAG: T9SS type A sorting domain-containing protein [Bacteroidetes bacterium]|nr:T9SS type A sorting domain-containing protein [Bacteroidota bacterium]